MTDKELKTLKDNLWHAADVLRAGAHLAANKYGQPILGLIFLRYADILFKQNKEAIEAARKAYDDLTDAQKEAYYKVSDSPNKDGVIATINPDDEVSKRFVEIVKDIQKEFTEE